MAQPLNTLDDRAACYRHSPGRDLPMQSVTVDSLNSRRLCLALGWLTLVAGLVSFGGWPLNMPRLTDWFGDGISIQPNTAVLIILASGAVLSLHHGYSRLCLGLGIVVAIGGALNLVQYLTDVDLGFNHQLLFGRNWGFNATVVPGRFGPPASISFVLIGSALALLGTSSSRAWHFVPAIGLGVVLLMLFSLLGYLFGARKFYAIPWLSAIALPTASMLFMLAASLVASVPQYQPTLLLCERSSAGSMARTVLPLLVVVIPLSIWLRSKGYEHGLFDMGTGLALGAALLTITVVALMWIGLLALRRREQREREADRRKDEFLATLAHELRNPLAPISNATALLKLAQASPEHHHDLCERATNTIERQLSHLVRLVDDLLDLSRISNGKLGLRREPVALAAVLEQVLEICGPQATAANQTIQLSMPAEPIYLDADPVRLAQVIGNLVHNACKFTGPEGCIQVGVSREANEAVVSVRDNGLGIPADMLASIFDMFSQVDQSLERPHAGLGIGLTLAKRLVELHGGSIQAFSEGVGKGSEFMVRLPIAPEARSPQPAADTPIRPRGGSRILIVDDNRDSARTLAEVLAMSGNETFLAHDGEEAVATAERQRPDAILLDIGMPTLNGFNACRRIRQMPWAKRILIIAVTGWGQEEDRRKSTEAGFDGHLVKPVELSQLMNLLECLPRRR